MAKAWTIGELETLAENAHLGAIKCTDALNQQYHRKRTVQAVEKQASRMHISLIEHYTCPACGRVVPSLERKTGYCRICHLQALNAATLQSIDELRAALEIRIYEQRYKEPELLRENDALRAAKCRARKRLKKKSA